MRRVYLLYWYWVVAGGLLGFGMLGLAAGEWPFLLVGLGMIIVGFFFHFSIH